MTIANDISEQFIRAFKTLGFNNTNPIIQATTRFEFGDYQVNGVMPLAKSLKRNPRELAQTVLSKVDLSDIAQKTEIAGPGFINIFLKPEFLAKKISFALADNKLGVDLDFLTNRSKKMMVEYSSPNLAKEMHVGHLRSTIIGDTISRIYEWLEYDLIRANHVGDWGTQFGMLIAYMEDQLQFSKIKKKELLLKDLESFYQKAKQKFDTDANFADLARKFVVLLQSGDKRVNHLWHDFVTISLKHCYQVYSLLGVKLTDQNTFGESAYNQYLPTIAEELTKKGLLVEDQGAKVVFLDQHLNSSITNQEENQDSRVVIIQKKDGGYLYSTTDIAAIRYRIQELKIKQILYVVDARQSQHFQQIFQLSKLSGLVNDDETLQHIDFGMVLGNNGKPLQTRTGGTIKLVDLLNEAISRAYETVSNKNPTKSSQWKKIIAQKIGISAIKYSDLSKARQSDYIFNWEKMLALEGNTAPYLQYAYTRIKSVFRKSQHLPKIDSQIILNRNLESKWQLSLALARFPEVIDLVTKTNEPHHLCSYLYNIAVLFSRFYETCPIINADISNREIRFLICMLTANILKQGLDLLGVEVMEEM